MLLRLTFLLLFALNLAVAAWITFGDRAAPRPPATDPGVAELRLLSERPSPPPANPSAELAQAPRAAQPDDRCLTLGPFDTQADMRAALDALNPRVPRIQYREEQAATARGWWVYLPAMATREQALTAARALATRGVHDYYVVTAGDRQNTISLGLFRDQVNAERRQAQIAALGFKPALSQRVEQVPQYFVDFVEPATPGFDWRTLVANADTIGEHASTCF
jgi:hypothetical protein